jgi:hypothetical protein
MVATAVTILLIVAILLGLWALSAYFGALAGELAQDGALSERNAAPARYSGGMAQNR